MSSLQKHNRLKGVKNPGSKDQVFKFQIKTSRLAVKVKMIEDEVGIADEMIEGIR